MVFLFLTCCFLIDIWVLLVFVVFLFCFVFAFYRFLILVLNGTVLGTAIHPSTVPMELYWGTVPARHLPVQFLIRKQKIEKRSGRGGGTYHRFVGLDHRLSTTASFFFYILLWLFIQLTHIIDLYLQISHTWMNLHSWSPLWW